MTEFFQARRLRYQILALIEERWQIVGVVEDDRDALGRGFDRTDFEGLERRVQSQARLALGQPGVKSIKILRERIRQDGFTVEEELLKLDAPPATATARQVKNYGGEVPVCTGPQDLLHRPALRIVGIILRPFLDRLGMTPIELVTLRALTRTVQREDKVLYDAIGAAARQQAEAMKVPARSRMDAIEAIVERCYATLRAAERNKTMPTLGADGLEALVARLADAAEEADRRFWALRGIAGLTGDRPGYGAKLEALVALDSLRLGPVALDLLDESIAGTIDQPELTRELLGEQGSLAEAMLCLAGFAAGDAPPASSAPELAKPVAVGILRNRLPKTRDALWDRLIRSLAGKQPLVRGPAGAEWELLQRLQEELVPRLPPECREPVAESLARRTAATRARLLDER